MIQRVTAHQEYLGKLLIVIGHHRGTRSLLGHDQEIVDIFHRTEGLLPEFELNGGVELCEASIEVMLEGIRILEVDCMWLMGIFCNVGEVEA